MQTRPRQRHSSPRDGKDEQETARKKNSDSGTVDPSTALHSTHDLACLLAGVACVAQARKTLERVALSGRPSHDHERWPYGRALIRCTARRHPGRRRGRLQPSLERDEVRTLAAPKPRPRNVLVSLAAKHQVRVFRTAGDGVLVSPFRCRAFGVCENS
jgi:hypothetical protein